MKTVDVRVSPQPQKLREIDIIRLQKTKAVQMYTETPKTMTAVMHANEADDSEFHCVWTGSNREGRSKHMPQGWPYCVKKVFTVPRQRMEIRSDPIYGMFYCIRVIPQFILPQYPGKVFWLVAQMNGRYGFLVPLEKLDEEPQEEQVHKQKVSPRRELALV